MTSSPLQKIKKHTRNTMDKLQLRITLKVLEKVNFRFSDTKQFMEDLIEDECQKEKISADEVFFLQV